MKAQNAVANRTWVGWLVVLAFGGMFVHVGVTGNGLGTQPAPIPAQWWDFGRRDDGTAGDGQLQLILDAQGTFSSDLRGIGLLASDEFLLTDPGALQAECRLIIVGAERSYRGRICESVSGMYRMGADGSDSGVRWLRGDVGEWIVHIAAQEQFAS